MGLSVLPKLTLRLSLVAPTFDGSDKEADMDKLTQERGHLALADRHISEAKQRMAALSALIERRRATGGDDTSAVELLRVFEETLAIYCRHRDFVLDSIAALEQAEPTPPATTIETARR